MRYTLTRATSALLCSSDRSATPTTSSSNQRASAGVGGRRRGRGGRRRCGGGSGVGLGSSGQRQVKASYKCTGYWREDHGQPIFGVSVNHHLDDSQVQRQSWSSFPIQQVNQALFLSLIARRIRYCWKQSRDCVRGSFQWRQQVAPVLR